MIRDPALLAAFLLAVETSVLWIASQKRCERWFSFLPSIFWMYFLPMLAASAGLIDAKSPLLPAIASALLPCALALLLISVDLPAIFHLGRDALIMFFAGSAGIVAGVPLAFFLMKEKVGPQMWSSFGALAGSWTGGSANLIAVKEAFRAPDAVFMPIVIVDTIVPYVWMGMLVTLAGTQIIFDRWNRSERRVLDELSSRIGHAASGAATVQWRWDTTAAILLLAISMGFVSGVLGKALPQIKNVTTAFTWTVIIVTTLGLALSFTPVRKLERFGTAKLGYFILYFVLTSIGARADISNLKATGYLILTGVMIVLFHAAVLLAVGRWIRAPLFLVATASQANIGGVASAPIVAEIYQKGMAPVGLLLAILGNVLGTYFGILAGQLCRLVI